MPLQTIPRDQVDSSRNVKLVPHAQTHNTAYKKNLGQHNQS